MSSVAKTLTLLVMLLIVTASANARELIVLAVGGAEAGNCNERKYGPTKGVYQLAPQGQITPAHDPLLLADCDRGSVWMPMATRMIQLGLAERVTIVPVAVKQRGYAAWRQGGAAFARLQAVLAVAKQRSIRFDFVLWQGGPLSADKKLEQSELRRILRFIRLNADVRKVLIAFDSGGSAAYTAARDAQKYYSKSVRMRRFPGADLDMLNPYERCGTMLSASGQEKLAELWVAAILDAERRKAQYDRESLIPLFE